MSDMINLDIEEIGREEGHLIRSCKVKINGNTVITPTRTIGVNQSDTLELKVAESLIDNQFKPFGEVYTKVSLSELNEYINNDEKGGKFCSKISDRVLQLKHVGALPYILFSITDDNGNPLNQLMPERVQEFIFDVLWGTPGNSIIATPLLGILSNPNDYRTLIETFHERQIAAIDRKNLPIMATVPPSYTLIDPKLLEKYWNYGCRIFGYNCENKKYGAFGYVIERLHYELSKFSKQCEELYIINGLNSRFKIGKTETSRINNLLGTGFGFDTYSPNHVMARFVVQGDLKRYIFNDQNYGFTNINDLEKVKNVEELVNTQVLKDIDLYDLSEMSDYSINKICKKHNIEKTIKEIREYPEYIENNNLLQHLLEKDRIDTETSEMKSFQYGHCTSDLDRWFK
ncbi:hypothetical protein C5S31_03955 [ANME-1 cluster archaeon GoMg2]|nr:hypothetical protein [ANME-1 cluster archaeon GoMg2]